MKILSVGNFLNSSWDGSIPDEEHIARALEELGHEVQRCQRGEENVYISGNKEPHDFILVAQWDGYPIDFIKNTKKTINQYKTEEDCPVVYWAFDYQAGGQEWHERLVKEADLYLSKRIADSKYPNWQYLSQDFAPEFLDKYPEEIEKDIDVLFTGSYLPWATERNETIRAVNEKYNLVIHSVNQWPEEWGLDVRPPVMDDGLPELYARAKINLAIDHTIEAGYWSDRAAQIMACGGFVLQRYVPLMETVFRSNIAYFFNKEDCLDKIEYWLNAEEDREMIAGQGYDNSWQYKVRERTADMLNAVRNIL